MLATMRPVLAVQQGNPKGIHTIEDLLRPGIQIAQANPDAAAIGKVTRPPLEKAGLWEPLKEHTRTVQLTVTDVANAVKVGTVDAGIVWDTTVRQVSGLEAVELPVFADVRSRIGVAALRSSKQPQSAARFIQYLASPQNGLRILQQYGYVVQASATRPHSQ
jgi:molybdate transport system substrate-binding protein